MTTKKRSVSKKRPTSDMRAEYRFDYSKSRPNRFASRVAQDSVAVVLEPDVAEVFDSAERVNRFLRSAMKAMPKRSTKRRAARDKE